MRFFILFSLITIQVAFGQHKPLAFKSEAERRWTDSVYSSMTFEERVGQLFMVAAYSNKDSAHVRGIDKLVKDYKVGGLIFFQGGPYRQAKLTNRYQKESKLPLFIGIDAEWGLSMRLDSTYRYPWNMTLGAVQDMALIEKMGRQMAEQAKRVGVHFNFAPVVDINTNPANPIIGNRSFGEDKINVTNRASALTKGIQGEGIYATGKHFPGHGDTATDSHLGLPVVNFDEKRIDDVELYPYKRLFGEGLASIMVAHLNVPALESTPGLPTSLSYNVITRLVQGKMGFDGLIFTDALNMKGASGYMQPGDVDLEAFLAGNDVLLFAENVPVAIERFREAYYTDSVLSESRLEYSVKKILAFKHRIGLNKLKPVDLKYIYTDLNAGHYDDLNYQLYEDAVTVLKDDEALLPVADFASENIAYVKMGDDDGTPFLENLQKYTRVTEVKRDTLPKLMEELKSYSTVIVGYHKSDGAWRKHDFSAKELQWLDTVAKNKKVILTVFAKPYALNNVKSFKDIEGVVLGYQNNTFANTVAAEIIFGAIGSKGKLPVSAGGFEVNHGIHTKPLERLGFTTPENVGMNSAKLAQIDQIVQRAIKEKMTPGAQVLVARHGKVIYQKSFGYQTYDNLVKVKNTDIYDVASLSKILGTLPNVMQQYDRGALKLEDKLGHILPEFQDTDKKNITVKDMLLHQSRFQAWEPFYKETLDATNHPDSTYYRKEYSAEFPVQVADSLYLRGDYPKIMLGKIANSKLLDKKEYKYSDFNFILMKEYLEHKTKVTLDVLAEANFYKPLGANNTTYNPLKKFDCATIAPTEIDSYFRYQVVQGYVHDMAAAMQGGVAGHAGLFSNSLDVAKIMQMYLQKGYYGGKHYFSAKTFDTFNTCYACNEGNRRGLGFDKPQLGASGPTCGCVSKSSFGHTGFTGTMAWADPETGIVYVFLSNRTYPDSGENKLSKGNIREDIQRVIQEAIIEK